MITNVSPRGGLVGWAGNGSFVPIAPFWGITASHVNSGWEHILGERSHTLKRYVDLGPLRLMNYSLPFFGWCAPSLTVPSTGWMGGTGYRGMDRAETWMEVRVGVSDDVYGMAYGVAGVAPGTPGDSGGGLFAFENGRVTLRGVIQTSGQALRITPERLTWINSVVGNPADWNQDGVVSIDDLWAFLKHWHEGMGDANGDGRVAIDDVFHVMRQIMA